MRLLDLLSLAALVACAGGNKPGDSRSSSVADTVAPRYATDFSLSESPLSDGGQWLNGGTDGLDWTDVSTTPHHAIGHQVGASYTDATAILKGDWGPNQSATATIFTTGPIADICVAELEMRLRSSIAPHSNRGYEVTFKVSQTDKAYLIIVRWNGVLGDFTTLLEKYGARYGVQNGDTMTATIVGNRITAYKNGVEMGHATDDTYTGGNPGMGFNLENSHAGCPGINDRYGFTSFRASDGIDR
jgi:hypothetical protein